MDKQEKQLIENFQKKMETLDAGREEALKLIRDLADKEDTGKDAKFYIEYLLSVLEYADEHNMNLHDIQSAITADAIDGSLS